MRPSSSCSGLDPSRGRRLRELIWAGSIAVMSAAAASVLLVGAQRELAMTADRRGGAVSYHFLSDDGSTSVAVFAWFLFGGLVLRHGPKVARRRLGLIGLPAVIAGFALLWATWPTPRRWDAALPFSGAWLTLVLMAPSLLLGTAAMWTLFVALGEAVRDKSALWRELCWTTGIAAACGAVLYGLRESGRSAFDIHLGDTYYIIAPPTVFVVFILGGLSLRYGPMTARARRPGVRGLAALTAFALLLLGGWLLLRMRPGPVEPRDWLLASRVGPGPYLIAYGPWLLFGVAAVWTLWAAMKPTVDATIDRRASVEGHRAPR